MPTTSALRVLDLFAGLRGWSDPFAERGHRVFTVEYDRSFARIDMYRNILNIDAADILAASGFDAFDIVLASPPCTSFTTMTMGRNWTYSGEPRTPIAEIGRALIIQTRTIIDALAPRWWVMENPRARLRTLPFAPPARRETVWYCRYGERRAKPTDLWGKFPPSWEPRPGCKNGNPDHLAAPRGSTTGTQGTRSDIAAKIPRALALDICLAAERDAAA